MPTKGLPEAVLIEALNLAEEYGSAHLAVKAGATKLSRETLRTRINTALRSNLRPTFRKDKARVYERERIGKMHLVIPDTQVKPGVCVDHMDWVGNYIIEKKPNVIVHIGDHWDMPSLSRYDKGKLPFEGRRYVLDVKAGRDAMERLLKPIADYNRTAHEKYNPEMHFCMGNHEIRISRLIDDNAEYQGKFDLADLGIEEYGWKVHDYLKPVKIDGIKYCHFFTSGTLGKAVTSAAMMLKNEEGSATMGHVQHYDVAIQKKSGQRGVFAATCYLHDEHYLGYQGNNQRRHILVKHEVNEGVYDLMEVSLAFLKKAYS